MMLASIACSSGIARLLSGTARLCPLGSGRLGTAVAWVAVAGCVAALETTAAPAAPAARPNIVFIMADDLGYTDLGCQGSGFYLTPHIDRLATEGMRLRNHHHCQNCTPTRAALMSGQYAPRTGVYTVGGIERFNWRTRPLRPVDNVTELPLDRETIADRLRAAGYVTGMFGKWHLGIQGPFHPAARGFDEAIESSGRHFDFTTHPPTDHPAGQYLADFLTDRAVDFIGRHAGRPFFLYLPHFGVHTPFEAKPDLVARFRERPPVGGHHDPVYAAMIASVDESVGRVVAALEEAGVANDTVIIFTSDNGGLGGYDREGITRQRGVTDNAPLRSGKGSLYEGGVRVPFIVRWPGVVPPESTCDVPTIHVDLFPTLLELAGGTPPRQPLDGESLVPLWRNPAATLAREAIFHHFPGYLGAGKDQWRTTPVSVVQRGDWKLMEFLEDGRLELYNLRDDLGEQTNLATAFPDRTGELHARLVAWREQVNAPMPSPRKPKPNAAMASPPRRARERAAVPASR
jgi:arylsulfatase A-like enzyme